MSDYFEGIKVGDRVWDFRNGWGVVTGVDRDLNYPIRVRSEGQESKDSYTMGGCYYRGENQSLFWDEIKFEIPPRPLPNLPVDAKVYVRANTHSDWKPRHFRRWDYDGIIIVFNGGQTSFTNPYRNIRPVIARYRYWKLEDGTTNCPED